MVSRSRSNIHDLLDNQLRAFDAAVLVHLESISKLHGAAIGRACLVKGNRVDGVATRRRFYPHLQVIFTDNALIHDVEFAGEDRFRKTGTPRPPLTQLTRETQGQSL